MVIMTCILDKIIIIAGTTLTAGGTEYCNYLNMYFMATISIVKVKLPSLF